jgi:hypothetical protein
MDKLELELERQRERRKAEREAKEKEEESAKAVVKADEKGSPAPRDEEATVDQPVVAAPQPSVPPTQKKWGHEAFEQVAATEEIFRAQKAMRGRGRGRGGFARESSLVVSDQG